MTVAHSKALSIGGHEKLRGHLADLGVATLSRYVRADTLERLSASGMPIDSENIANYLVIEKGIGVLRDKTLRLDLLTKFDPKKLHQYLPLKATDYGSLKVFNDFNWGDNQRSVQYLSLLGLSGDILRKETVAANDIEAISESGCLYPYQNHIRKSLVAFLAAANKSRVIVHMPTGSGKTRTALEAVCDHVRRLSDSNVTIVWFAHSEELCEQAVEAIKKLWVQHASETAHIVRLWGGRRPTLQSIDRPTFIVTSFQTAYSMLTAHDDERFSLFGMIRRKTSLLIVDEAHQSTAPTYRDAIELFANQNTKIVGLTATPGRHHISQDPTETAALANFYEGNKIDIVDDQGRPLEDPIAFLTQKGILSELQRFQLDSSTELVLSEREIAHIEKHLDIPKSVLRKLGEDSARTSLIATQALKLAMEFEYPTIVFAPSKDNAVELATICRMRKCSAASITGETDAEERKLVIQGFKKGDIKILTNFGVLTAGFDAPNIKAVIIARPTTSVVLYSQMIGRGLRGPLMGGSKDCVLVDVHDNIVNMPPNNEAFTYFNSFYER